MTFKPQIEAILAHPYFKLAISNYMEGESKELKHLLFEALFHTYKKSTLNARRTYGKSRWLNTCVILEEIENTPPPDNLDLLLPIPPRKSLQNIVEFQKKKTAQKIRNITITNQLNLFLQIA